MSTLVADRDVRGVPQPIVDKLRAAIRRARTVLLIRGVLGVASVALISLLAGMAIDASLTVFSTAVRAALSFSLLAVVLVAAYWFLVRPLARTFTLTGIARIIENRHPELEERMSSAVELLTSRDLPELRGSEALIAELAREAVGQVDTVSPAQEFTFRTARPYFITALLAAAILAVLFAIWPDVTVQLVARVMAPFANIGNVQARDLEVTPGDIVLAEGDSLRVEVVVPHEKVASARLRRLGSDRAEITEQMKPLSSDQRGFPRFFVGMAAVTESFRYRIHTGGALSRYHDVMVVPRPAATGFEITYDFPAYMSRQQRTVTQSSGDIRAPLGTQVAVSAIANVPVVRAQMRIAGLPVIDGEIAATEDGTSRCTFEFTLADDLIVGRTWTLRLIDRYDFQNFPTEYLIKAEPDQPPAVAIVEPVEQHLRLKPTDALPILFHAADDHGIDRLELLATLDDREQPPRNLPLPEGADRTAVDLQTVFDLASITRDDSRTLTLQLRAHDNLPADLQGPQAALSEPLTITLDAASQTYFEEQSTEHYATIRDQLQRVLEELQAAAVQTRDLHKAVQPEGRLQEPVLARIDQVRDLTGNAQQQLVDLGESLPFTPFAALEPEVADLAETDVQSARDRAGQIKLTDLPQQRAEHSRQSDQHVQQAVARTEQLLEKLEEKWQQIQEYAELQDLAARQAQLAEKIATADLQALPELPLAGEQLAVAEDIAQQITPAADVLNQVQEAQRLQAQDLVQQAKQLAEVQAQLAKLTEESNQPEVNPQQLHDEIAQAIAKEQQQIAAEAAQLDRDIERADKAGPDKSSDLAKKPQEVLDDIQQGDLSQATANAQTAAQQLDQAAAALENNQSVPDLASAVAANPRTEPQTGEANNGAPEKGSPSDGMQQNSAPQQSEPQDGEAASGEPQNGKPQDVEPQDGKSQDGKPQSSKPQNGQSEDVPPDDGGVQNGAPQSGELHGGAPQAGIPQNADSDGPPPKPSGKLAAQAADLAVRQQQVAERLQALAAGNLDQALAVMQNQTAADAVDLAIKTAALAQLTELFDQPAAAQTKAAEAAQHAGQAAEQAAEAGEQLASAAAPDAAGQAASESPASAAGEPAVNSSPAAQAARQDAIAAQQAAAQSLAATAAALEQAANQMQGSPAVPAQAPLASLPRTAATSAALAQAADSAAHAFAALQSSANSAQAQAMATQSSQQAAQSLADAAGAVAQAASIPQTAAPSLARSPMRGYPSRQLGRSQLPSQQASPGLGEVGRIGGTLDNELELKLKEYGISAAQWTRLPGHLKNQIRQAEVESAPEEYRELVRRYFREIARRGGRE